MKSQIDIARDLVAREAELPLEERLALWEGRLYSSQAWSHECAVWVDRLRADLKMYGIVKPATPAVPGAETLPPQP